MRFAVCNWLIVQESLEDSQQSSSAKERQLQQLSKELEAAQADAADIPKLQALLDEVGLHTVSVTCHCIKKLWPAWRFYA